MAGHYVVRKVTRAAAEVIAGLREAGVATAHEAAGRDGLVDPAIRPRQDGAVIAGSAVTVSSHPGDNLMIHAAVEMCREGDILVVTTTSPSTDGMFGDLLATSLRARGVAGLVTDAGVRDIATLRAMGFPVWARAVSAQGTVKASPGSVNVPVVCGGRLVRPGDVIIADDDGVMCVPAASAEAVLAASRARVAAEEEKRAKLESGVLGVDMYGLRDLLEKLGVRYVDELPQDGLPQDGLPQDGLPQGGLPESALPGAGRSGPGLPRAGRLADGQPRAAQSGAGRPRGESPAAEAPGDEA